MVSEYEQHFALKQADGFSEEEIAAKLGAPAELAAQFEAADEGGKAPCGPAAHLIRFGVGVMDVVAALGMVVLAPILQDVLGAATGLNLLNASLVLAIMSLPTICSVSEDALRAVPRSLREASLALGATRWETIVRVVVPAALSGIGTAIMLGMSRAMGETMVVLMAAGGAAMLPQSLLDPVRPMPASIAAEMAEAPFRSDHYYALFATGIVLFLMTLAFNMIASRIAEKHRQVGSASL